MDARKTMALGPETGPGPGPGQQQGHLHGDNANFVLRAWEEQVALGRTWPMRSEDERLEEEPRRRRDRRVRTGTPMGLACAPRSHRQCIAPCFKTWPAWWWTFSAT